MRGTIFVLHLEQSGCGGAAAFDSSWGLSGKFPCPEQMNGPFLVGFLLTSKTCPETGVGWAWRFGFWIGKPGIYSFGEGRGGGGPSRVCQVQRAASQSLLSWVPVRPKLTVTVDTNVNSTILNLEDDVRSWKPGDTLVVASTDYSMYQAEEFQVLPCKACAPNQVRVAGRTFITSARATRF